MGAVMPVIVEEKTDPNTTKVNASELPEPTDSSIKLVSRIWKDMKGFTDRRHLSYSALVHMKFERVKSLSSSFLRGSSVAQDHQSDIQPQSIEWKRASLT